MKRSDTLGPGDTIGEGDTSLVLGILSPDLAESAFRLLREEVEWSTMSHRGGEVPRLVAVQGQINEDGSHPIYRHPADHLPPLKPFSPTVESIRRRVEGALQHPVNHVLIQCYRSGSDYISEHSDKTIDIVRGSKIVNVSMGAERVMTLRAKAGTSFPGERRVTQRIPLPHNSMFVLGLETNRRWLHSIRTDKRPEKTKSEAERFQDGERVSLTFRHIGTFLTPGDELIYGQGAKGKTRDEANPVLRGGSEANELIAAFGNENHDNDFDWNEAYGKGYDILHFTV